MDIRNGGPDETQNDKERCLTPIHLAAGFDPSHFCETAWIPQCHGGLMDGACLNSVYNPNNLQIAPCPQYSYVIRSDLQPYFDIATSYGFANYMFQTNEGPGFPAHQFILSGTSAPAAPGLTNYLDFVAENAGFDKSGCPRHEPAPGVG